MTTGKMAFSTFLWAAYGRILQTLWWLRWAILAVSVATVVFWIVKR